MTACALVPCRFEWTDSLSWQYNFSKKEFLKFHFREKELCHHLCRRQRQRGHLLLKIYTKFIPMFTDPIYQLQMSIIHQKNLRHLTFTTLKDIKIRQPGPEKRVVSKCPSNSDTLEINYLSRAEGPRWWGLGECQSCPSSFMISNMVEPIWARLSGFIKDGAQNDLVKEFF